VTTEARPEAGESRRALVPEVSVASTPISNAQVPARASSVDDCRLIDLPKISDRRGNLTFIEESRHIPFDIRRVYYLYDVPGGETRAGHAHRRLQQFLIAASGSFDVVVRDLTRVRRVSLNRSYFGLYIPPLIWRELVNFSTGSVCLSLVSEHYDENEYIRDFREYEARAGG
jgi:dTDP-4-dehydrorhamnose 3,5-epimerase-like enzyme